MKLSKIIFSHKILPTLIALVIILVMLFLPNQYENPVYKHHIRVTATVLSVDNSLVNHIGLITYGDQIGEVEVSTGIYKGQRFKASNMLLGKLESDKLFKAGDKALIVMQPNLDNSEIVKVTMVDHYRLHFESILVIAFAILLIVLAGWLGVRAIVSFVFTVLALWKVLIPAFLMGYHPVMVGMLFTLILTTLITMLVYGFGRCFLAAVLGSFLGIIITAGMAIYFVDVFKVHGAVMSFSENLLYSGFSTLNLNHIFIASIFIASSGAVMDVAVDITSAVSEVVEKKPDISKFEAIKSGLTVGRAVIGTMTTTLLLAYSGGYLALLMVFVGQGVPLTNILNFNYVSAEILHTMVGSFGLITVVPFTAITSGVLLAGLTSTVRD
ncbi:YibE/F family protein [Utexia brackfieldae]|uniref:YibE/F family protein n=1 Tax=Utexia brackfieldae TaxID=3074108 RepID=UPI00370DB699